MLICVAKANEAKKECSANNAIVTVLSIVIILLAALYSRER